MDKTTLNNPQYNPNAWIDWLIHKVFKVRNDAELARKLGMAPAVVSKIRHRKLAVGAVLLVKLHDLTGMPIKDIRRQMGIEQA